MADLELSEQYSATSKFAWEVYKSCQDAGWAFDDVARAVISLHTRLLDFCQDLSSSDWTSRRCEADTQTYTLLPQSCTTTLTSLSELLKTYKANHKHISRRRQWGDMHTVPGLLVIKEKLGELTTQLSDCVGRLKPAEGREERVSLRKELLDDVKGRTFEAPANMAVGIDVGGNGESAQDIWKGLLSAMNTSNGGGNGGREAKVVLGKCEPQDGKGFGLGTRNGIF